jgi:hypothetical protein
MNQRWQSRRSARDSVIPGYYFQIRKLLRDAELMASTRAEVLPSCSDDGTVPTTRCGLVSVGMQLSSSRPRLTPDEATYMHARILVMHKHHPSQSGGSSYGCLNGGVSWPDLTTTMNHRPCGRKSSLAEDTSTRGGIPRRARDTRRGRGVAHRQDPCWRPTHWSAVAHAIPASATKRLADLRWDAERRSWRKGSYTQVRVKQPARKPRWPARDRRLLLRSRAMDMCAGLLGGRRMS